MKKLVCFFLILNLISNIRVEYQAIIVGSDPSGRRSPVYIELPDEIKTLNYGETTTITETCIIVHRGEVGWDRIPVQPKWNVRLKNIEATVPMQYAFASIVANANKKRKVILNYPPVSSVWHLPAGIAQLTTVLRAHGHEVLQRYGHIIGLEYVLKEYGGEDIELALATMRNPQSDINALYDARMTFERVSGGIVTQDKFEVARNNASFVSSYYDGTIERALEAVKDREQHLWYDYFTKVEMPLARDFKPDLYGVSVADERQFIQGLILASMVKDEIPGCLVVLGGNFWGRMMHAFHLEGFEKFFDLCCHAIVYAEGFQIALELAETLDPSQCSGTVWCKDGKVIVNPRTTTPIDFETLPTPHYEGYPQWSPDIVPNIYTMSNCPMQCGFCAIAAASDSFLKKPRSMSPKRIAEHMIKLGETIGATRFDITDETFSIVRQLALGEELKRLGHKATWECYLTITDELLNETVCRDMFERGCRAVQLGLESLSPETLKREHKGWNHPKNYAHILANLKKAGIQTHVFLLIGLPGEPLHWGLRWLAFLERHGENILTIKAGRYRLTRMSPEEQFGKHSEFIEVLPDDKPLHLNRNFRYRNVSNKRIDAMRDVLEEACRRHWAYAVTSTIPWWVNRGQYTWKELEAMAKFLPQEPSVPHLDQTLTKVSAIVRDELNQDVKFKTYEDVLAFARTLL